MINCNLAKDCRFPEIEGPDDELRAYLTSLYCAGNFRNCARYRAAARDGNPVADEILPNEDDFRSLFSWALSRSSGEPCSSTQNLCM